MKLRLLRGAFLVFLTAVSPAALVQDSPVPLQDDPKFPNGKSQRDEILKIEREQNIRDAAKLVEMAEGLKADLEKNDRFVLSVDTIRKTDDIEKLVRKIRNRLHH